MARYGCTVTVAAGKIPSSQSNFSWLITEDNLPTAAIDGGAQSILNGGGNLRCYTDYTKATQIAIEVVSFVTGGTPNIQVWGLSSTLAVASTVYIEADTVAVAQPVVTDTYGRNSVWVDYVAVYHFESLGTQTNSTGGSNNLTENGNPTLIAGKIGNAVALDGTGDYYSAASQPRTNESFTISAWAASDSSASSGFLYDDSNGTSGGAQLIYRDAGNLRARLDDTGANAALTDTANTSLGDGVTRFVTYTADKTSVAQFYLNGVADGSSSTISSFGDISPTANMLIGAQSSPVANYLDGSISDFQIKSGASSADYITSEYNNQNDPATFWTTSTWADQDAGGSTLVASGGVYTYSGTSVATLKASVFKTDSGSYSYNGDVAGLLKGSLLSTDTSNYAYTGTSTTLTYAPAGTTLLAADTGNYSYSGGDITFSRNRVIITSSGNYTYSGSGVSIILPGQIWTDKPTAVTTYTNKPAATTNWTDK